MSLLALGNVGGISIWWNPQMVFFQQMFAFDKILTSNFRYVGTEENIFLSTFYGPSTPLNERLFLNQLKDIKQLLGNVFLIVGGDFKIIRSPLEKKDGVS